MMKCFFLLTACLILNTGCGVRDLTSKSGCSSGGCDGATGGTTPLSPLPLPVLTPAPTIIIFNPPNITVNVPVTVNNPVSVTVGNSANNTNTATGGGGGGSSSTSSSNSANTNTNSSNSSNTNNNSNTNTNTTATGASGYTDPWTYCSEENNFCFFVGKKTVRYGKNGFYSYRLVENGTPCTNSVFTDPAYGVVKSCWYGDSNLYYTTPPTSNSNPDVYDWACSDDHSSDSNPLDNICSPFNHGTFSSMHSGAKGVVKYLTDSQPRYSSVKDYDKFGTTVTAPIYLENFNVPTREWTSGFQDAGGNAIKDNSGNALSEYFSLHFTGRFKNSKADGAKKYQFAMISDDGAIFSIYDGSAYQELINNDGTHSAKLACANSPVMIYPQKDLSLPFKLDYYQGPRTELALVLLYREWTSSTVAEPLCGNSGSNYWFNPANSAPQDPYNQLLTRGWKPVPGSIIYLNDISHHNPCM